MDEEPGGEKEGEGRENLRLQAWQPRLWHRSLALGLSSLSSVKGQGKGLPGGPGEMRCGLTGAGNGVQLSLREKLIPPAATQSAVACHSGDRGKMLRPRAAK